MIMIRYVLIAMVAVIAMAMCAPETEAEYRTNHIAYATTTTEVACDGTTSVESSCAGEVALVSDRGCAGLRRGEVRRLNRRDNIQARRAFRQDRRHQRQAEIQARRAARIGCG